VPVIKAWPAMDTDIFDIPVRMPARSPDPAMAEDMSDMEPGNVAVNVAAPAMSPFIAPVA